MTFTTLMGRLPSRSALPASLGFITGHTAADRPLMRPHAVPSPQKSIPAGATP